VKSVTPRRRADLRESGRTMPLEMRARRLSRGVVEFNARHYRMVDSSLL
jgi:hypothetical protein